MMSDIWESQWLFHQTISSESLAHCISPSIASDLDISNPHEYADICY